MKQPVYASHSVRISGVRIAVAAALTLGISFYTENASAATPVPCSDLIANYLDADDAGADYLEIVGARVTARSDLGYSSFTMHREFQIETTPLHTPASVPFRLFTARRVDLNNYAGDFSEVFTDRGNGTEGHTSLWIRRGGFFWTRASGATTWRPITNVVCYSGPEDQIIVTGHIDGLAFGTEFWSFVIQRRVSDII